MDQRKFIVSDPKRCTACGICELACSGTKMGSFNPLSSRIRTVMVNTTNTKSIACQLCEDPRCVKSCPRKALKKNLETGVITINEKACDGCCWCIQSCEFGSIILDIDKKKIAICDLCDLDPQCIKFCPKEALELKSHEQISQKHRREAIKKLIKNKSSKR